MASGKRHLFVGLLSVYFFTFIISNYFFQPSFLDVLLYVVIGLLFALWPDVDTKSLGQKVFYMIFFLTDLYLIFTLQYKLAAFFGFDYNSASAGESPWLDTYTCRNDPCAFADFTLSHDYKSYPRLLQSAVLCYRCNRLLLAFTHRWTTVQKVIKPATELK